LTLAAVVLALAFLGPIGDTGLAFPGAVPGNLGLLDFVQMDAGQPGDAADRCTPGQDTHVLSEGSSWGTVLPIDDDADYYLFPVEPGRAYSVSLAPWAFFDHPGLPAPNADLDILDASDCLPVIPGNHQQGNAVETLTFIATPDLCQADFGCAVLVRIAEPLLFGLVPTPVESAGPQGQGAPEGPPGCWPACVLNYRVDIN
jgi:hypothetical protein